MAATQIPLTFRAAPLPTDFVGTPQDFADALVARLSAESANDISFFAAGSVAPTSNVGPWLKNDQTWYVWSDPLATYVPEVIEFESLRYIAQQAAPDQTKYTFWIELDGTGKAIAIKYYSGGAWKSVYEDQFAQYSTTTQMEAAIEAAKEEVSINYPVAARLAVAQSIITDSDYHVLNLTIVDMDPDSVYNSAESKYVAPVDGIYQVSFSLQIDNDDANAAEVEFSALVVKNGLVGPPSVVVGTSVPTPSGLRWYPAASGLVQMAENDFIQLQLRAVNPNPASNVTVVGTWYAHLIRRL